MSGVDPYIVQPAVDPIDHPPHYAFSTVEPIDAIEAWELGFCLGNTVKYIARAGRKGGGEKTIEDLKKALWYLEREIAAREKVPAAQVKIADDIPY